MKSIERSIYLNIFHVVVFSIAMGFLETAVVVYLRKIYYPEGFSFPLKQMSTDIVITELLREAATIVMLLYIGFFCGKTFIQRFAFFLLSFAVWDIFYYVFLKLLLNWPLSFFEWDILFLIPLPWLGPVLAPCIISATMILLAVFILTQQKHPVKLKRTDWLILILVSLLYICTFVKDQFHLLKHHNGSDISAVYVPQAFNWTYFMIPLTLFALWFIVFVKRELKRENNPEV